MPKLCEIYNYDKEARSKDNIQIPAMYLFVLILTIAQCLNYVKYTIMINKHVAKIIFKYQLVINRKYTMDYFACNI